LPSARWRMDDRSCGLVAYALVTVCQALMPALCRHTAYKVHQSSAWTAGCITRRL
jgi:hypothetical protein